MGRLVESRRAPELGMAGTTRDPTGPRGPAGENYATRVAKYIPGEVLAAYVAMQSFAAGITAAPRTLAAVAWAVFAIGLACTPLYLARQARPGQPVRLHLSLSTIAFCVWAYALGGPFAVAGWHVPAIGSIALVAFTLVAGLFEPVEP